MKKILLSSILLASLAQAGELTTRIESIGFRNNSIVEIKIPNTVTGCPKSGSYFFKLSTGNPSSAAVSADAKKEQVSALLMAFSTGRSVKFTYEDPTVSGNCWVSRVDVMAE